jgi:glycosyltransferase involved in cell wall biosynthesis
MKITVGQLGGRMYYGVPQILEEAGCLTALHTDYVVNKPPFSVISSIIRGNAKIRLSNRTPSVSLNKIHQVPFASLCHLLKLHLGRLSGIELQKEYLRLGQALERSMLSTDFNTIDAFLMIGSTSANLFKKAKQNGVKTIMEQIIAPSLYTLDVMQSEWDKYPAWESGANEVEALKFWGEVNARDWDNADMIICGSQFVIDAVKHIGGPWERCVVVPYGVPQHNLTPQCTYNVHRPLRVLTVGAVGLRKGSHYILEAAKSLIGQCEFKLAGGYPQGLKERISIPSNVGLLGHVPRVQLKQYFEWADVFLLPSLSEGSATVCYEALQYGLPLIVTHNAGQFITDGKEGIIIPIKSSDAIVSALESMCANPDKVHDMSAKAYALSPYASYDAYRQRILAVINTIGK